jgi:hypothetical protein
LQSKNKRKKSIVMFRNLGRKNARVAKAARQAFHRGDIPEEGLPGIVIERRRARDLMSIPNPPRGEYLELDNHQDRNYSDRERYIKTNLKNDIFLYF